MSTATLEAPATHAAAHAAQAIDSPEPAIDLTPNITADTFDVTRHDCRLTIENTLTGQHRTFQIKTVRSGALQGKRIVSLLTGTCNDDAGDWTGFAFADEFGVRVWRKYRGEAGGARSEWEVFGRMLECPRVFAGKGARYLVEGRCRRCGRVLTNAKSLKTGYGPDCSGRND